MGTIIQRIFKKCRRIMVRLLSPFSNPLRVGVIGFGGIGPDHLLGYEASRLAKVIAISDIRPAALGAGMRGRTRIRAYLDYQQLLSESRPEVISICTWPQAHLEIALASVKSGIKGIMCEKPVAIQLSEIKRMASICAEKGVKLGCGHQHRFNPYLRKAAELVRNGALGNIIEFKGHTLGVLADNGPHLFDAARFILGDVNPVSVKCQCVRQLGFIRQGLPAEDSSSGEIIFDNGVSLIFSTGTTVSSFFEIYIRGSSGAVRVTLSSIELENGDECLNVRPDPFYHERHFHEFLNWVKGKQSSYGADFKHGAISAEIMLASYESARLGEKVSLPLQNEGNVISELYSAELPSEGIPYKLPEPTLPKSLLTANKLAVEGGIPSAPKHFLAAPEMGLPELANLTQVILSKRLNNTEGTMVTKLQQKFCHYYGASHAIASTSGTAALHVAMGALQLNPGDEVITTPLSDMGTVIPILACNCLPIFADIDPQTGMLTAETIEKRITPKTRAVILVHLFGKPAEMDAICALVKKHNIFLIEDCAQAHGAEYNGKKLGTYGDFGCFSLQQLKHITCGDGGVTICQNKDLAEKAALFSDKGWLRGAGGRNHYFLGMNYRMTELQGAVALAQMKRLPANLEARRASANRLCEAISIIPGLDAPSRSAESIASWWIFDFGIDEGLLGVSSEIFQGLMSAEGIVSKVNYLPMPLFEYDVLKYQKTYGTSRYPFSAYNYEAPRIEDFPGFKAFNRRVLIFWSSQAKIQHADAISGALRKIVDRLRVK